jgi:putative oxidoreductase
VSAVLWLLQIVLALVFLALGLLKVTRSRERLLAVAPWVEDYPEWAVTTIGVLELLGAAGVVLPGILGVAPGLVPVAAAGLVVLMVGAVVTHLLRREPQRATGPAVLLLAALLVAVGRSGPWPL